MQITINIEDHETKAIESHVESVEKWLAEAVKGKANSCIKRISEELSTQNPKTMTEADRITFINSLTFEPYSPERQQKQLKDRIVK